MRFDLKQCVLMINGREITDFADGADSITFAPNGDIGQLTIGATGKGVFVATNNNSVTCTFNVLQNGADNEFLSELLTRQRKMLKSFETVSLYFKDTMNGDEFVCTDGYFITRPNFARGNQYNSQQWVITFIEGDEKLAKGWGN